jgi:hypothetical protein
MDPFTIALIIMAATAAIAGTAGATGIAATNKAANNDSAADLARAKNYLRNPTSIDEMLSQLRSTGKTGNLSISDADLAKYSDDELKSILSSLSDSGFVQTGMGESDLLSGFSENELDALLEEEYGGTKFRLSDFSTWGADHDFDWDAFEQDYQNYLDWRDKVGEMPDEIDYDAVANLANAQIDAENAQVGALYDQMLSRSEGSYRNALAENNAMYNDQVNTLLSNSAAETNALAGSMAWQQKRATRNAITRGASAAQRLTASINAQLGTQAQASTQALETSNTLAQMLLSQRQAASSIRQSYNSDLNEYTGNKASLLSGTAERKASYRNSQLSAAESMHDAQMDQWNNRLSAHGGDGPFTDFYRKQQQRSQGKSTYTY